MVPGTGVMGHDFSYQATYREKAGEWEGLGALSNLVNRVINNYFLEKLMCGNILLASKIANIIKDEAF